MTIGCAFFGHVGRDAEAKTSKNGNAYLRLSVRAGEGDAAQWVTVMYFGDDVAELAPRLEKGSGVYIEGTIRLETWEKQDGTKSSSLTVMASHCRPPQIGRNRPKRERKPRERTAPAQSRTPAARTFHDDPMPF
jgi:single-strand DNA-binding protein